MTPHRTRLRRPATVALLLALAGTAALAVPVTVQLRGPGGQPLAGAAVAIEVKGRTGKTSSAKAEMGQRDRQFTPQLLVVQFVNLLMILNLVQLHSLLHKIV